MKYRVFIELCRELGLTPQQLRRAADEMAGVRLAREPVRTTPESDAKALAALRRAGVDLQEI